ncbi:hypothetical protein BCR42DRAFT_469688 [Absidia repens]|uniref:C-type lectin domain-containing protein n=1 Tax=Absidia repens TaxID=90262 RepID=A0A1X2I768_9FUNG|nr:hypothetical protein BCR42DRAFT_469688 [Absidia repens]
MKLLLILSAMTVSVMSQSRCPLTVTHDGQHTFTLATLTEKELEDRRPEAIYKEAAEACFKDCNTAEIMSFSTSYWKHRSPMTILDRAAKFLVESDFFQVNDTYFVNHIAVDEEGPVGFGCFALETDDWHADRWAIFTSYCRPSEFSFYSLDDPVCSSTTSVVCGMPSMVPAVDGQKIANAVHTLESHTDTNNTADTVNPDDGNGNHTTTTLPRSINLAEVITKVASSKSNENINTANHINTNAGNEDMETEAEGQSEFPFFSQNEQHEENISIDDLRYSVIRLHQVSPSSASVSCDHHYAKIGSLYSSSIPQFSKWFQRMHPSEKIIIESWNGDNYGAKDNQCLTFSVSNGVHLCGCSEASTVLCEKMFT